MRVRADRRKGGAAAAQGDLEGALGEAGEGVCGELRAAARERDAEKLRRLFADLNLGGDAEVGPRLRRHSGRPRVVVDEAVEARGHPDADRLDVAGVVGLVAAVAAWTGVGPNPFLVVVEVVVVAEVGLNRIALYGLAD